MHTVVLVVTDHCSQEMLRNKLACCIVIVTNCVFLYKFQFCPLKKASCQNAGSTAPRPRAGVHHVAPRAAAHNC